MKSIAGGFVAFAIVWMCLGNSGCKGDLPAGPFPAELPTLTDPIPFDSLAPGKIVFQRIGPPENNYIGAYVVDINRKSSTRIASVVVNEPAISPDGSRITFTTLNTVPTGVDVYIMDNDGANHRPVSDIAGQEQSPSWTFDGKQILFLSVPFVSSGDSAQLYRQSPVPNAGDRMLVIDFGKRIPRIHVQGPASADSTGKLMVAGDGIWTISGDSADMNLLIPAPGGGKTFYSPAWSPDGRNIALLSVTRAGASITSVAVVMYAADGTGAETLVTLPASGTREWPGNNIHSLCWSPDGSQIAFTRPDGIDLGAHIYAIRKDRTGLTQVTSAPGVTDRSLSWGAESKVE